MLNSFLRTFLAWLSVVALLASGLVLIALPPQPADAATITISGVQGQLSNHRGTAGTDAQNCIKYSPSGSATSTGFVPAGQTAITAHGYPSNGACPTALSTASQSALAIRPNNASSVQDGQPFLLTSITHYNNPISGGVAARYTGTMTLRLGGFTTSPDLVYTWSMWETPNADNPCAFPAGSNQNGCADQLTFTSSVPTQELVQNGIRYKLVINGFGPAVGGVCPATPGGTASPDFLTPEGSTTTACIYASLVQIRTLTITKRVESPTGVTPPAFSYSSTSSLNGSAWQAPSFTLSPTRTTPASVTRNLLQGETVSVTEGIPADDRWSLTSIQCLDGAGNAVPGLTTSTTTGAVTIPSVAAPPTVAAGAITCTYTNTYTPKATLTLQKQVLGGGPATPSSFTLTASGPAVVSGPAGTTTVQSRRIPTGTYNLTEAATVAGYDPGSWSCVGQTSLAGSQVVIGDGQVVTCTIANTYATGRLQITKTVSGPTGGYTGGSTQQFSGTYQCGTAAAVPFSVTTGQAYLSGPIPSGTTCTVTETTPTAGLLNSSYTWQPPSYSSGGQATIPNGGAPATVAITNTYAQQTGTISLSKLVSPRPGTPAFGYTGGTARPFTVDYTCRIDGTVVASGSVVVRPDTTTFPVSGLPATSTCSLSETQAQQTGDFLTPSFHWDGVEFSAASVVVPANGTATSTVTNFYARDTATLTLTKQVEGDGYTGTGAQFSVTWDCGIDSGTVTLAAGGSETVGVPANVACSVTEAPPSDALLLPAYDWLAPSYAGLVDGAVSVPANEARTVTVTNQTQEVYGKISVQKATAPAEHAAAVRQAARFDITVTCTAAEGGATLYSETFSLPVGLPAVTPNLPAGTSCDISESPPGQAALVDDSYMWGSTPAVQTVSVTADDTTAVTVTNTIERSYGTLSITKEVVGLDDLDGSGTTFSGTWSCDYGADPAVTGTWSRVGSGPVTLDGPTDQILVGSTCTVYETGKTPRPHPTDPSYVWGPQTVTGPVVLTAADPDAEVTVTNPINRVTGSFGIGKAVRGGVPGDAFTDGTFTFDYLCTLPDTSTQDGTLQVSAGGQVASGPDLPVGTSCEITEQTGALPAPIDPYRWDTAATTMQVRELIDGQLVTTEQAGTAVTVTIGDAPVNVTGINYIEQTTAAVTATKQIAGATGGYTGVVQNGDPATFTLTLTCTLRGATVSYGTREATAGGPAVSWADVPVGSDCSLAEQPIPLGYGLVDASYRWDRTPVYSPASTTVAEDGSSLGVTNTIVRAYSTFALAKNVISPPGVLADDRPYGGDWQCTHATGPAVTGTWSATGAGPATLTGIPAEGILLGSECTATTETTGIDTAPSPDPSYAWQTPVYAAATVTADGTATATVTNTVVRSTVDIDIAKTISGDTAGYAGTGTPFHVDARCFLTDPNDPSGILREVDLAPAAGPQPFLTDIPAGWTCQVGEVPPDQSLLLNDSYEWQAPTYTGLTDGQIVATDGAADLSVDNPIGRRTGDFAVEKAIAPGTPPGVVLDGAVFTGSYSCAYNPDGPDAQTWAGTWSVTGAGLATLEPALAALPVGTTCAATESAPDDAGLEDESWTWTEPTVGPAAVIGDATTERVVVTNVPTRVYTSMSVTLAYTEIAGAMQPGLRLDVAWTCTAPDDAITEGVVSVLASGETVQLFAADGSIVGPTGPIRVPAGSTCSVAQQTLDDADLINSSYTWNTPAYSPSDTVTTARDTTASVTITNSTSRDYRPLEIEKRVTGADGLVVQSGLTFEGTYQCTYPGEPPTTGTWVIDGQSSTIVNGVLHGSECTITGEETQAQLPIPDDESYKWAPWSATGPVTITEDAEVNLLVVSNPVERELTELRITKQVAPATGPAGTTYNLSYRCVSQSDEIRTGQQAVAAGETWTSPTDIPIGSTCTVTEGPLPDPGDGYTWGAPVFTVTDIGLNTATTTGQTVEFDIPPGRADKIISHPVITVLNPLEQAAVVIDKKDAAGNDGSDPAAPAPLGPDGTDLVFTVTNTGSEPLVDVTVTDTITTGRGTLTAVSCAFPDGSSGPSWAGPLAPGATVTCTAHLSGLVPGELHTDSATVTATGQLSGVPATGTDQFHGRVPAAPEPTPPGPTPPGPTPPAPAPPGTTPKTPAIAYTGIAVGNHLALAVALLAGGAALVITGRRRPRRR